MAQGVLGYDISIDIGGTEKGFMLAQYRGVPQWAATPLPMFAPRNSIDAAKYAQVPPEQEAVWVQKFFHGGMGMKIWEEATPSKFFYTDCVDTRFKGIAFIGPAINTVSWHGGTDPGKPCVGFAWFSSGMYAAFTSGTASSVWKYSTADNHWDSVNVLASNITTQLTTGLGNIIQCLGGSAKYQYSSDGASWSAATATNAEGAFVCEVRGALWLAKNNNSLYSCSAINGTLTAATTIGDTQYPFTSLMNYSDLLMIGKEDGLYCLDRDGLDYEILPETKRTPHALNFVNPCVFQNRAYYPVKGGLLEVYLEGGEWVVNDITPAKFAPEITDLPSQVYAAAATKDWLYVSMRDPVTATTNGCVLAGRREVVDGAVEWRWHRLYYVTGATDWAGGTYFPLYTSPAIIASVNNQILWLGVDDGGSNTPVLYARLPLTFQNPYNDSTYLYNAVYSAGNVGAKIYTAEFDAGFADIQKAFTKLDVLSASLSSTHRHIRAYYSLDDGAYTAIATDYSTSPLQTVALPSTVTGRKIQLRFNLLSDSTSSTPGFKGFVLHYILRPKIYWRWVFTVRLADNILPNEGMASSETAASLATFLATAYTTVWPSTLYDLDGTSHSVILRPLGDGDRVVKNEVSHQPERHYTLEALEAILT